MTCGMSGEEASFYPQHLRKQESSESCLTALKNEMRVVSFAGLSKRVASSMQVQTPLTAEHDCEHIAPMYRRMRCRTHFAYNVLAICESSFARGQLPWPVSAASRGCACISVSCPHTDADELCHC